MMAQLVRVLLWAVLLSAFGVGCGGSGAGNVPVDSPIVKFQPPDPEDLAEDEDDWDAEDEEADDENAAPPADTDANDNE